jgi:short-subunit dehydrogenase
MGNMATEPRIGKRVVITGASTGIGLAAAWQLAAGGVEVVTVSRDPGLEINQAVKEAVS